MAPLGNGVEIVPLEGAEAISEMARSLGSVGISNPRQTSIFVGRRVPSGWYMPFFPFAAPLRDLKTGEVITTDDRGMINATEFEYWGYDVESDIAIPDTRLDSEAPYGGVSIEPKKFSGDLTFRGLAARLPWDKLAYYEGNALGRYLLDNEKHPARLVDLDIQLNVIKPLITNAANFGYNVTKAGGQEWGAGGNMYNDVETAANAIWQATGVDKMDLQLILTQASYQAAQKDAGFVEFAKLLKTGAQNGRGWIEAPTMAEYLGVGSVKQLKVVQEIGLHTVDSGWLIPIAGSQSTTGQAGDPGFMTGDEQMFDYGSSIWGAGFAPVGAADGTVMPYYDEPHYRRRWHPYHRYFSATVIRAAAGAKLNNLKA